MNATLENIFVPTDWQIKELPIIFKDIPDKRFIFY